MVFASCGGAAAAGLGFLAQFAQGEQLSEIVQHTNLKPGEPDALALAAQSDAVETVVPIATSDQRQSVRADGGRARDGPPAMFEQRTFRVRRRPERKGSLSVVSSSGFASRNGTI